MIASKHPEVIGGRQKLIAAGIIDSGEAYEYGSIYHYGTALDEEDASDFQRRV